MKTAKTLQLLDANNNNISPAVCVESLYFEKSQNNTTYRMSLKNRIILAGENITTGLAVTGTDNLQNICVPSFNIQKETGTSTDSIFYKLNCETYNIGKPLYNAVSNFIGEYCYSKNQLYNNFLKIDGTNAATEKINVGADLNNNTNSSTDAAGVFKSRTNSFQLIAAKDEPSSGINWQGKSYIYVKNTTDMNIYADSSLQMTANNININTTKGNIDINSNDNLNLTGLFVNIESNSEDVSILSGNDMYIKSAETIEMDSWNIDISAGSIDIDTSYIKIFDRKLSNPNYAFNDKDSDSIAFLYTSKGDENGNGKDFNWGVMPILTLTSYESQKNNEKVSFLSKTSNLVDTSVYFKDLVFLGKSGASNPFTVDSSVALIDYGYDNIRTPQNIRFKGFISGNTVIPLIADNNSNTLIRFRTINGKSIIENSETTTDTTGFNIEALNKNDVSIFAQLNAINAANGSGTFRIWGTTGTEFGNLKNHLETDVATLESVYFKPTGAMFAQSFYASSDERLKTDIQSIDTVNAPEIKKFTWKDTSVVSYGFIAQDLEKAGYGELVSEGDNGYKKVNYDAALSLKIASLENENKKLKKQVDNLTVMVSQILKKMTK